MQNTSTVPVEVSAEDNTETSARGQASAAPLTLVIILAAVLGSVLGLTLVGGAVAMIICLVLCRRRSSPLHKDVIAAIQGMHMVANYALKYHWFVETVIIIAIKWCTIYHVATSPGLGHSQLFMHSTSLMQHRK